MQVKELIKELEKQDGELDVVIDRDEDGWHAIGDVDVTQDGIGDDMVNISISR